jgi:hypothetical protein
VRCKNILLQRNIFLDDPTRFPYLVCTATQNFAVRIPGAGTGARFEKTVNNTN